MKLDAISITSAPLNRMTSVERDAGRGDDTSVVVFRITVRHLASLWYLMSSHTKEKKR